MSDDRASHDVATDDGEFERLGRLAGAELRRSAPPADLGAVEAGASRRRLAPIAASGVVVIALVIGGLVLFGRDEESDEQIPATSVPIPPTTAAASSVTVPIAYQASSGGMHRIFVFNPSDGSHSSPTADVGGGDQTNPDWSPDGTRLVFGAKDSGRDDLWLANVDGSGSEILIDCGNDCLFLDDPAWDPNGESVVYSRATETETGLLVTLERVDLNDRSIDVLLTAAPNTYIAGTSLSRDGNSVVLEIVDLAGPSLDAEALGVSLAVVDLSDTEPTLEPLTDPGLFAETADWSPDGGLIVYSSLVDPAGTARDLFTIAPDGSNRTRVTRLSDVGGYATDPSFLPNGNEIVMAARLEPGAETVIALTTLGDGSIRPALGNDYRFGSHPQPRPGS